MQHEIVYVILMTIARRAAAAVDSACALRYNIHGVQSGILMPFHRRINRKDDCNEKALQGHGFGGPVRDGSGTVCGASDFDGLAQELKEVGLFQGTDTGFELDRAPTRAESAVMLVRLLGAEETAKADLEAGKTAHPFTDVPEWAKAHVAWLYTNKLTNGISETEFGSDSLCNAQMYCTFVLCALGYSDGEGGQFAYDEAVSFAAEKGVYNTAVAQGEFLRDDVVAVSYQALFAKVNGQENTLLAKLIADGAVSQTAAQPLLDKQETYAEYVAACAGFEQATGVDMDMTGTMDVTALGAESVAMEISSEIKTLVTDTDVQMEGISTVKTGEEQTETVIKQWIKDGVMYMEADGQKSRCPWTSPTCWPPCSSRPRT